MAYDKVVDSSVLDAGLTAIANAIREKAGTEGALAFPDGLVEAIGAIETGGGICVMKYTPAEDVLNPVISHSLGSVPECAILIAETDPDDVTMLSKSAVFGFTKGNYHNIAPFYSNYRLSTWTHGAMDYGITASISGMVSGVLFCNATEESIKILNGGNTLTGGVTYFIILFAEGIWQ